MIQTCWTTCLENFVKMPSNPRCDTHNFLLRLFFFLNFNIFVAYKSPNLIYVNFQAGNHKYHTLQPQENLHSFPVYQTQYTKEILQALLLLFIATRATLTNSPNPIFPCSNPIFIYIHSNPKKLANLLTTTHNFKASFKRLFNGTLCYSLVAFCTLLHNS